MTASNPKSLPILRSFRIASPCDANWEGMSGDDRVRHCGDCKKNVYYLENMTEPEIIELVHKTGGNFCGRMYKRSDGTVLLEDCPIGLRAKTKAAAKRVSGWVALACAGALSIFGVSRGLRSQARNGTAGDLTRTVAVEKPANYRPAPRPIEEPLTGGIGFIEEEMGDIAIDDIENIQDIPKPEPQTKP